MSALGMASLGTLCDDRALGMASLGTLCGVVETPVAAPRVGGYSALNGSDTLLAQALREDEELILLMRSFIEVLNAT